MKRFYCTVCKRVKRVQKWPSVISNVGETSPVQRMGVCDKHARPTLSFNSFNQKKVASR